MSQPLRFVITVTPNFVTSTSVVLNCAYSNDPGTQKTDRSRRRGVKNLIRRRSSRGLTGLPAAHGSGGRRSIHRFDPPALGSESRSLFLGGFSRRENEERNWTPPELARLRRTRSFSNGTRPSRICATSSSALRPSRLAADAKLIRSGSVSRVGPLTGLRRLRFSATRGSFRSRSSSSTVPMTYASIRFQFIASK